MRLCREHDMGFIAMKGLSGGLLNNATACYAFMQEFDHVVPIWGIQYAWELEQWVDLAKRNPRMTPELQEIIDKDRRGWRGISAAPVATACPAQQELIFPRPHG